MLLTKKKRTLFVVADPNFESNKNFEEVWVDFDECYVTNLVTKAITFWKDFIFPVLHSKIKLGLKRK